MKKPIVCGVVALVLSGCAASHQTVMPDGSRGLSINCSGSALSWNQCYEKAGDKCPHGYNIVSKDGDNGNASFGAGGGWAAGGVSNTRTLLVTCKP